VPARSIVSPSMTWAVPTSVQFGRGEPVEPIGCFQTNLLVLHHKIKAARALGALRLGQARAVRAFCHGRPKTRQCGRLSRYPRKNVLLSVNYLTLLDDA
jgi:hypothetical protein